MKVVYANFILLQLVPDWLNECQKFIDGLTSFLFQTVQGGEQLIILCQTRRFVSNS
ncbi:hypothetical protein Scep_002207 [Stephania cephalantha]|uniref:Uncharacterized protein n=1 Tax=Stephania cephalantha TaxID=152367 RepID=A0AAP0L9R2_9MAGN